jgi:hypothetical protein
VYYLVVKPKPLNVAALLWLSRQTAHKGRQRQPLFGPETIMRPQGGWHTSGTTYYSIDCPLGTFVAGFTTTPDSSARMIRPWIITSGDSELNDLVITSLWPLRCSNGKPVGSSSKPLRLKMLSDWSESHKLFNRRSSGYSGVTLYAGKPVDAVSLVPGTKYIDMEGHPGLPGHTHVVLCPTGQVITGIYGEATAAHVISVGLRCKSKE